MVGSREETKTCFDLGNLAVERLFVKKKVDAGKWLSREKGRGPMGDSVHPGSTL